MGFLDKAKKLVESAGNTADAVERGAQMLGSATAKVRLDKVPTSKEDIKKIKTDALQDARTKLKKETP